MLKIPIRPPLKIPFSIEIKFKRYSKRLNLVFLIYCIDSDFQFKSFSPYYYSTAILFSYSILKFKYYTI